MRAFIRGVAFTRAVQGTSGLVRVAVCATLGILLCLWSAAGLADQLLTSAISAQSLATALAEFAHATGLQLVYVSDVLRNQNSKGAPGGVSTTEALTALLDGTGLTFEFLNPRAVRIVPRPPHSQDSGAGPMPSARYSVARPGGLEEVDVIGHREQERLLALAHVQSVPSSLSITSGDELEAQKSEQLVDYAASIPGMNVVTSGTPGEAAVIIRGIINLTDVSSTAFYIDDTPISGTGDWGYANNLSLDLLAHDLERLEVWRGPQGASVGADSEIGLVRYVLIQPNISESGALVAADVSAVHGATRPGEDIWGAANLAFVPGHLGVRASVYGTYTPGYIDNLYSGAQGINALQRYGGRIAARWEPTEPLSINLNALWYRLNADSMSQVTYDKVAPVPNTGLAYFAQQMGSYGDLVDNTALLNPENKSLALYSMTLHWTPGLIDIQSTTSWSRSVATFSIDWTAAVGKYYPAWSGGHIPAGLALSGRYESLDKFSEELRVSSARGARLEWMLGGFYTHEYAIDNPNSEALDKAYRPIPFFAPSLGYFRVPSTVTEQVLFGNAFWHVTRRLDLGAGIRVAHYDQSFTYLSGAWNLAAAESVACDVPAGCATFDWGSGTETDTTWMVSADYRMTPSAMLYARVATGLAPGSPNGQAPPPGFPASLGPETVTNYELGLKAGSAEDRALIDLSLFYVDWKDIQVLTYEGNVANGAHGASRGFELTTSYAPVPHLQLGYNAAYIRCELDSVIPEANFMLTGYQLAGVPKWTMSGTADYTWPLVGLWSAHVGGAVRWVGQHWDAPGDRWIGQQGQATGTVQNRLLSVMPAVVVPAYAALDANAQISKGPLTLRIFGRNLTDKRAYLNRFVMLDGTIYVPVEIVNKILQPRTVGVGVGYVF
jgi:outer membrane receptor protein involved in Fe transport